jgi:cold shock CspA family protein
MKNIMLGTVKFVHPNGYGFADTTEGDVFFHVAGFCKPEVVEVMVSYPKAEIDPKDIKKGVCIGMIVEEGPKGKAAVQWCFMQAAADAAKEVENTPIYRLVCREIITGKPYGDPVQRCWVSDQWLSIAEVFQGYKHQLDNFHREPGAEYQVNVDTEDGWVPCECPLGRFNGGSLFDLPLNWKQSVRSR